MKKIKFYLFFFLLLHFSCKNEKFNNQISLKNNLQEREIDIKNLGIIAANFLDPLVEVARWNERGYFTYERISQVSQEDNPKLIELKRKFENLKDALSDPNQNGLIGKIGEVKTSWESYSNDQIWICFPMANILEKFIYDIFYSSKEKNVDQLNQEDLGKKIRLLTYLSSSSREDLNLKEFSFTQNFYPFDEDSQGLYALIDQNYELNEEVKDFIQSKDDTFFSFFSNETFKPTFDSLLEIYNFLKENNKSEALGKLNSFIQQNNGNIPLSNFPLDLDTFKKEFSNKIKDIFMQIDLAE